VGEPVALSFVLARSASAAVRVEHVTAFPTGFEFQFVDHIAKVKHMSDPMRALGGLRGKPLHGYPDLDADDLRLRVRYADGPEAVPPMAGHDVARIGLGSQGPSIHVGDGSAGGSLATAMFWMWPVPPPGPLTFVCEWPRYGIPPTRRQVDAGLIREAAERAVGAWPDDEPSAT
jgi:hypothetical protein